MTIVQHTLQRPDSDPITGVTVSVRLVTSGYVTGSKVGILSSSYAVSDAAGFYSIDLEAQSAITPAGTYYIVEHLLKPQKETFTIQVPDGAGPFELVACLVTDLLPPGEVAATLDALNALASGYVTTVAAANMYMAIATYDAGEVA